MLGSATGSFVNLCIDRMPAGQSIIAPSSHCDACGKRLGIYDLVPLFNYLWLRGRCRYCRASIPLRVPIVELVLGLLFAFLYWRFGLGLELAISLVYASLLILIFVIDLEHQLVLDKVVYPGMAFALAFSFFWPDLGPVDSIWGGAIGLGAMGLPFLIYRQGMGFGDVKLGALVGLMTGYPLVIIALLLAVIVGGILAALILAFGIKKRKDPIPFAPFLATAAMITLLWGKDIHQWYTNWWL
ncbi:prepilin peptidase [Chloroflexota bacterium]